MKKILGLDLGSSSIGWAYIHENENSRSIINMGVRIVPVDSSARDAFSKGQAISINKDRTLKRTARKTLHRYKLRKVSLLNLLEKEGIVPTEKQLINITSLELYGLRNKAVSERIELSDFGRILFHLNQKRGYRSSRKSGSSDESGKKLSDYLQEIKEHKDLLDTEGITIGQYFFRKLQENPWTRIKKIVFPRECYIQEFERIWEKQQTFHGQILTEELKTKIKDQIIFYQRPLKSAKWLVGECRFEKHHKVTPVSSPLFQLEKIWESVHNISLNNKRKENYTLTWEQKQQVFDHLNNNDKLTSSNLNKILGLSTSDGWRANEQIRKAGIQGNITRYKLLKAFRELDIKDLELLRFNLSYANTDRNRVDPQTGEIIPYIVDGSFEREPLYQLWHILYSIEDPEETINTLIRRFGLTRMQAEGLSKIDFTQSGFGNKSARAIRKLLPALQKGYDYSKACDLVGYKHSDSLTKQENEERALQEKLEQYPRNSLRQPVVEKILNQLVNVVNEILRDNYLGRPDVIRVELARELKQSKEERERTYKRNNETDRINKQIVERLAKEFPGLVITRKVLEKYKLHEQQNGLCLYSGDNIPLSLALKGDSVDIDHIIPQSRLFDDSFQNKVLVFQRENKAKDNLTAFDYMQTKGEAETNQYLESVNRLFDGGNITKSKRDKLLMAAKEIPEDFINRQLNESRYIAREAVKLLKGISRNVYSTTGSVTEFLRHQWGYNEVLKQLNWSKYEEAGLIKDDKIEGWSKRDDHRHHAIDALVVACTKQSFIQQLNTLNSSITREQMQEMVKNGSANGWQGKRSLLEQSVYISQPFTTQEIKEAVAKILISQKPGKRVSALGKNLAGGKVQRTLTPRGFLHKEFVYGKIKRYSKEKVKLNSRFNQLENIANPREKQLVSERLNAFGGDPKKAFQDLEKSPIWLDEAKSKALTAVTVWEESFVIKYPLGPGFKEKDVEFIIDPKIREQVKKRFTERGSNAMKDLEKDPIWLNESKKIPIVSVRCFTGLTDLVPLHNTVNGKTYNSKHNKTEGKSVDFVSTRNNHHIAIYETSEGKLEEKIVTLWEAVARKNWGLPVIVRNAEEIWDLVQDKGIEDQALLSNLPLPGWKLVESLQQNEMFVFRMSREELGKSINENKLHTISPNLYRVQKISEKDYNFRHHLETRLGKDSSEEAIFSKIEKSKRFKSLQAFKKANPIKVKLSPLGKIQLE